MSQQGHDLRDDTPPHTPVSTVETSYQSAIVGRETEISRLASLMEQAKGGRGFSLFVTGEPGIGKTRLLDEFNRIAKNTGWSVARGSAEKGSYRPFQAISEAMSQLSGASIFETETVSSLRLAVAVDGGGRELARVASTVNGDVPEVDIASVLSVVQGFVRDSFNPNAGALGKMELGESTAIIERCGDVTVIAVYDSTEQPRMRPAVFRAAKATDGDPSSALEHLRSLSRLRISSRNLLEGAKLESERIRVAEMLLQRVAECTKTGPAALLLEDLHWADEPTLALVEYIARNAYGMPFALVCTGRPGENEAFDSLVAKAKTFEGVTEMPLSALDCASVGRIVKSLSGVRKIQDEDIDALAERCGGNPLFIIELMMNVPHGASTKSSEDRISIPENVESVIRDRLSWLAPQVLSLAEYASCAGREFPTKAIASNGGDTSSFEELLRLGILQESGSVTSFRHAVYQEAIYASTSNRWRVANHRRLGEYYESAYAGRLEEAAYDLARHFSETSEHEKSLEYCMMAGERAEHSFAAGLAARWYERALTSLSSLSAGRDMEKAMLLERIGDAHSALGEYDQALHRYADAEGTATDPSSRARFLRKEAAVLNDRGQHDRALEIIPKAMAALEETGSAERGRILMVQGSALWRKGEYDKALSLLGESLRAFKLHGAGASDMAAAFRAEGNIHWGKARYKEALESYERSLILYEEVGDERGACSVLNNIGVVNWNLGRLDKAAEHYQRSLKTSEKLGDLKGVIAVLLNLSIVSKDKGDSEANLEYNRKCLEISQRIGDLRGIAWASNNIGIDRWNRGDVDGAMDCFRHSLAISSESGDRRGVSWSLNNMGRTLFAIGELDEALDCYGRSLDIRVEMGDLQSAANVMNNIGAIYAEKGESAKAEEQFEKSMRTCHESGDKRDLVYSLCGMADLRLAQGDVVSAKVLAEKSLATALELGSKPEEAAGHFALARVIFASGDVVSAVDEFEKASALFSIIDDKVDLAKAEVELANCHIARGEVTEAKARLRRAIAMFEGMKMRLHLERCHRLLESLDGENAHR